MNLCPDDIFRTVEVCQTTLYRVTPSLFIGKSSQWTNAQVRFDQSRTLKSSFLNMAKIYNDFKGKMPQKS